MPRRTPLDLNEPELKDNRSDTQHIEHRSRPINRTAPEEQGVVVDINDQGVTKRVKLNLEVDATSKDLGPNPYKNLIHLGRAIDAWRPFPRLFIIVYLVLLYRVVEWFMKLSEPNLEQSGLVSIVVGAGAAWFGLYVGSGRKPNPEE